VAVFLDRDNQLQRGNDDRLVECAHCGAAQPAATVVAAPDFAMLTATRPVQTGAVLQCAQCGQPVFVRYRVRAWYDDRVELFAGTPVERAPESFPYGYLPEPVARSFRDALGCYGHELYQAFAVMCRLTARAVFAERGERGKLELFDRVAEVRDLAGLDEPTFNRLRRVIFDSDLDRGGAPPELDATQAAVLLETMKDALYQTYVRGAKLRKALEMRTYFATDGGTSTEPGATALERSGS